HARAQRALARPAQVDATHAYLALLGVIEPEEQPRHRRLAAARAPQQPQRAPWVQMETQIPQSPYPCHLLAIFTPAWAVIGEADAAKLHRRRPGGQGLRPVLQSRPDGQQLAHAGDPGIGLLQVL